MNFILGLIGLILGGVGMGLIDSNIEGRTSKELNNLFGVLGIINCSLALVLCYIALGYGENQGVSHRIKTIEQISNACSVDTPQWFVDGCKAALLAPTAINQQKFRFEYAGGNSVVAKRGFSLVGYTRIDLGIAKLHFEIGANNSSLKWINK